MGARSGEGPWGQRGKGGLREARWLCELLLPAELPPENNQLISGPIRAGIYGQARDGLPHASLGFIPAIYHARPCLSARGTVNQGRLFYLVISGFCWEKM